MTATATIQLQPVPVRTTDRPTVVAAASKTDRGLRRDRNEDALLVTRDRFAVADGVGGNAAGEVASGIALAVIEKADDLRAGVLRAHAAVKAAGAVDEALSKMATTLTAAAVDEHGVTIAHVGDSRAYRLRDGHLQRMTPDQTVAAELARRGRISTDEAAVHPLRSTLMHAIGGPDTPEVYAFRSDLQAGDVWLLCTDGLTDLVDEAAIATAIQSSPNLPIASGQLVTAALRAGGRDNVSVVLFAIG